MRPRRLRHSWVRIGADDRGRYELARLGYGREGPNRRGFRLHREHGCLGLPGCGYPPGDPGQPGDGQARVRGGPEFCKGDMADGPLVDRIFAEHPDIDAVIHCAALIVVPDSVADPVGYYRANVAKSLNFAAHLLRNGCRRLIFSSSAAIYRAGADLTVDEDSPIDPQSPYARTKAVCEAMFADIAAAQPIRVLSLRYFNPIGADPKMRTGLQLARPTHALGKMIQAQQRDVPSWSPERTTPHATAQVSGITSMSGTWPRLTWPRWAGSMPCPVRRPPSTWGPVRAPRSGNLPTHSAAWPIARSSCARPGGGRATSSAPTPAPAARSGFSAGVQGMTSPMVSVIRFSGPRFVTRSCPLTRLRESGGSVLRSADPRFGLSPGGVAGFAAGAGAAPVPQDGAEAGGAYDARTSAEDCCHRRSAVAGY